MRRRLLASITLLLIACKKEEVPPPTTLQLAVVAPLSGSEQAKGVAIQRAVELLVNDVNRRGGVSGHSLAFSVFDDAGSPERAAEVAKELTSTQRFFAVIGHHNSASSLAALPVYDAAGMLMVSPSATNPKVTARSEWAYTTVGNDVTQGRFLAAYAKHALYAPEVVIAADSQVYGRDLATVFVSAGEQLKLPTSLVAAADTAEAKDKLVAALQQKKDAVVFVAAGLQSGAEIIATLRQHKLQHVIIAADALATERLSVVLGALGCSSTQGLFLGTPLLFDASGAAAQWFRDEYRAKFNEEPLWHGAFAYDAAKVIVQGLKTMTLPEHFAESEVAELRVRLRGAVAQMVSPEKGVDGATGVTYFASDRSAPKPFAMANLDDKLSSAYVQLTSHARDQELVASAGPVDKSETFVVGDLRLARTHVVFVGARFNRVSAYDVDAGTFIADLDLWFRYRPPFEVQDFEIVNAVTPVALNDRFDNFVSPLVGYTAYHVTGTFKADFLPHRQPRFGEHFLGVSLRHKRLSADDLLYVVDERGMGVVGPQLAANLRERQVFDPDLGWEVKRAWLGQEIRPRHVRGDPRRMLRGPMIDQSTFQAVAHLVPASVSPRRQFVAPHRPVLLAWAAFALVMMALLNRFVVRERLMRLVWTAQMLLGSSVLVLAEEVTLELLEERVAQKWLIATVKTYHIAWWVLGAWLAVGTVERFLWRPLERRTARAVPRLARQAVAFLIGLIALLGVVAFVFKQSVTLLAMGGAVVAVVIGIAVQRNIADVFSGLAINLETPFRVGDWIRVAEYDEGQVIDLNWRTTKIQNRAGSILNIPNDVVAHNQVENFSFPNSRYAVTTLVRVSRRHAPDFVGRVFERAIRGTYDELERTGAKPDKRAIAEYQGVEDDAAVWRVGVGIHNYGAKEQVIALIQHSVWEHAARVSIDFVSTQPTVHVHQSNDDAEPVSLDARRVTG